MPEIQTIPPAMSDGSAALLRSLVHEVQCLNERLDRLDSLQQAAESLASIATDVFDEQTRNLVGSASPPDQRLAGLLELAERLTRKPTLDALAALADRAPQLAELAKHAEAAPDLFAMLVDVFDEWAAQQAEEGLDVGVALRNGLRTALWLGNRISEAELDRLGMLLRSDVIDPRALEVVSNAATALVQCQQAASQATSPERAGLLAGLRALGNRETQQALAFAIRFSQKFGQRIGKTSCQPCNTSQPRDTKETS